MLISVNRLKELIEFDYSPAELDKILTMLGIEVEAIYDYSKKYENFFIGEVLSKDKHPQADKLSLCTVRFGEGLHNTVVCGAPNVAAGQKIVYASLNAVVPQGGFKIEKRKIRGIESKGMICSQHELDLGEDTSGIWVLPEDAVVGTKLADYCNMNDTILEISVTPNRPDCLSHFGIAREIAAYKKSKFTKPEIKLDRSNDAIENFINVEIEAVDLCPKYYGLVIKNVKVQPSPEWLKQKIVMLGLRPINAIVDATNYVMYETGQPLHAFDLNKIAQNKIVIKTAKDGDKFTALDDKERTLDGEMMMICDGEKSIAIAGVMGGANSEIDNNTTDIFIESAYFNPTSVRRTSKKLNLSTDASYRFERGVDPQGIEYAAQYVAQIIKCTCGGEIAKGECNLIAKEVPQKEVTLRFEKAVNLIGENIAPETMIEMLKALEFGILEQDEKQVKLAVPTYRVDIEIEVDVIEEIAIMHDYDKITPRFSTNISFGSGLDKTTLAMPKMRPSIRNYFVQSGFIEILTQNIIDPASAKMFIEEPITIANPLGEEMSVMRPSLLPSMLKTIERNIRYGNSDLCLFEIGKTFNPATAADKTYVPGIKESEELIVAITGGIKPFHWSDKQRSADYYDIKGTFENFIERFNFTGFKFVQDSYLKNMFSANSLTVLYKGEIVGKFGEISKKTMKTFDIAQPIYIMLMNLEKVYKVKTKDTRYSAVSPFPVVKRDLGFIVPKATEAGAVRDAIMKNGGEFLKGVEIFDIYEGEKIGLENKNIAFALTYSSAARTLVDQEVDASITSIVGGIEKLFGGKLREF